MKQKNLVCTIAMAMAFFSSCSQDRVEQLINEMSLDEKVGQLIIVSFGEETDKESIKQLIEEEHIGGLIAMECEMEKYCALLNEFQQSAQIPLLMTVDGEWGASMRFDDLTKFPRNMQLGALSSPERVYEVGKAMAAQFARLGIHVNYAPTVDINNNPKNPVIGSRSFGDNREKVAEYGAMLMKGLHDGGIWTSAKHFPGHGDTDVDSHKALPLLSFDRDRLDSLELYPFQRLIDEGASMVMVGHLSVPALDSTGIPSSISYPIITELLKEKMGFKGIVVTDALEMKGVAEYIPEETIPLASFKAGSDLLLMPPREKVHECKQLLIEAVEKGEISEERLHESLRKVLLMKDQLGLLDGKPVVSAENIYNELETPEVLQLIQQVCDESLTLVKRPSCELKGENKLADMLENGKAIALELDKHLTQADLEQARKQAVGKEYVVLSLPEFKAAKNDRETFSQIEPAAIYKYVSEWAKNQKMLLAILDTPYVLDYIELDAFDGVLVAYSTSKENRKAVEKVIGGELEPQGVLSVSAGGLPNGFAAE